MIGRVKSLAKEQMNIYAGGPRRVPSTTSNPPRVGLLREGAPFSPDYVPAPAIDRCAEA
jgi:hypothetical protein